MVQSRALLIALVASLLVAEALAVPRTFASVTAHKTPDKPKEWKGTDIAKNVFSVLKKHTEKKALEKASPKRMLMQSGSTTTSSSSDATSAALSDSILEFYISVGQSVARQLMQPKGADSTNMPRALLSE